MTDEAARSADIPPDGDGSGGHDDDATRYDEEAGPVVRPYAVTGGRTRADHQVLDLVALVAASGVRARSAHRLVAEHHRILALSAAEALSLAELSAYLDLPLGVVRVLLGDLLAAELVVVHRPPAPDVLASDQSLLEAVIDGLRAT